MKNSIVEKACLYGIPLGILAMMILNRLFQRTFDMEFALDYRALLLMVVVLFTILALAMSYAIHKIGKDSIVETIRQESI